MKTKRTIGTAATSSIFVLGMLIFYAGNVFAHCDTADGPVIPEAKAAIDKGDVTPVLKWVKQDYEPEIKTAFKKAVTVRAKSPEAKELADQYFLETLVRLHRAGEGAPYSGISAGPVEPIVRMSDEALAHGSADEMIKEIKIHLTEAVQEKFNRVVQAKKDKDKSVHSGREFVEAYVAYMHYVEGIHAAIERAGAPHAEHGEGAPAHKH